MLSGLTNAGKSKQYFIWIILLITLCYFVFEYFFILFSAFNADEFVFARHIYEYTFHLPYRDFPPYKTVLGHYLLALPMFFSHQFLQPLYYIKDEIALINSLCIGFSCLWGSRFFSMKAILMTILALLANQLFLIYSVDLRVDMLTSWTALFAIFLMLGRREKLAGIMLGIGFLISQKALWYFIAIDGAILLSMLRFRNSIYHIKSFLLFSIFTCLPILIYIFFWSLISNPHDVLSNLFYEAYIQAAINFYTMIYLYCWESMLNYSGLLYLLLPCTFLIFYDQNSLSIEKQKTFFSQCTALIAFILFINYKQPFPYNFVFTMPLFFICYANFFTWLFNKKIIFPAIKTHLTSFSAYLTFFYLSCMILSLFYYPLTPLQYLLFLAPFSLIFYLSRPVAPTFSGSLFCFLIIFFIFCIVKPLYTTWQTTQLLDGKYQKTMLQISNDLLKENGSYIGGVPFLYQQDQPISGMKNLIGPAVEYLNKPSQALGLLQLSSLYLAKSTPQKILDDFEKTPVKMIINNYRMLILPLSIRNYINNHYLHFYGSLYLYSPLIPSGEQQFNLKFTGTYQIKSADKFPIMIDGARILPSEKKVLKQGRHTSKSIFPYRLALTPDNTVAYPTEFQEDNWLKMLRAILV